MSEQSLYLSQLRPDPAFAKTLVGRYLTNIRLVSLAVISIIILGIVSYISLPKRLNPEVNIPIVIIQTIFPGGSPQDIETLISIPIEDQIKSVSGIDTINSTSVENVSVVTIEFESNTDPDKALQDIQSKVNAITDLPDNAQEPRVEKLDFENQPVWEFALTFGQDIPSLYALAQTIEEDVESLVQIDRVEISGLENNIIQVILDPKSLAQYNLDPLQVSQSLNSSFQAFPSGNVYTTNNSFALSLEQTVTDLDDLRRLTINLPTGESIQLGQIATIQQKPKDEYFISQIATGSGVANKAVTLSVFKSSQANIDDAVQAAQSAVDQAISSYPSAQIIEITNNAADISTQTKTLQSNFTQTIILVFITLLIFLGIRQATIASISIPLTFLISFTVMQIVGISVNFLSLFSLLLALGLVVDDAIVIISAMTTYHSTGKFSSQQSGFLVWKDFIIPIWTTTITTVWAFLPLLLSSGIIGEFIKSIPIVVSATLLASTSVAVLINLPLMIVILNPKVPYRVKILFRVLFLVLLTSLLIVLIPSSPVKLPTILLLGVLIILIRYLYPSQKQKPPLHTISQKLSKYIDPISPKISQGFINTNQLISLYSNAITKILSSKSLRRQTILAVVFISLTSYALIPAKLVQNEFFPKIDADILYIVVESAPGTNKQVTTTIAQEVYSQIITNFSFDSATLQVGLADPNGSRTTSQENTARITLNLIDSDNRDQSSFQIAQQIRDTVSHPQAEVDVIEQSGGPPAGADVQVKFSGESLEELDRIANDTINYLSTQPGLTNIEKSIKPGISKLSFQIDQQKAVQLGIDPARVGAWLRLFASGLEFDSLTLEQTDTDIVFLMSDTIQSPDTLNQIQIPTPSGGVSLSQIGSLTLMPNPTIITREDGQRTISVSAAVSQGYSVSQTNQDLTNYITNQLDFPDGYIWQAGGVNQENQESVSSILQAMIVAFILILATMVIQLNSFRKALIVILVIPLAASGVFLLFGLLGIPLSFPALIGVLALFGIVVNNSIVIVEKINQNIAVKIPLKAAVVDASASRLEPIMLSSLTTIMGLLPITISDPLWRGLGGAIIAGLSFSGVIMLVFIPTVYYAIYKPK